MAGARIVRPMRTLQWVVVAAILALLAAFWAILVLVPDGAGTAIGLLSIGLGVVALLAVPLRFRFGSRPEPMLVARAVAAGLLGIGLGVYWLVRLA